MNTEYWLIGRVVAANDAKLTGGEVRLLSEEGEEIGVVSFAQAFEQSADLGRDLVEIAPNAAPPVVKIMNYGKMVYEKKKQEKLAKKKQQANRAKEVKFHVNIDTHDYETKINRAIQFLGKGYKLKITLQYRGREMAHQELGRDLMRKVAADLQEHGSIEAAPKQQGRNCSMMIGALSKKK